MEPQNNTDRTEDITHTTAPTKRPVLTLPAAVLTGLALIALAIVLTVPGMKKDAPSQGAPKGETPGMPTSVDPSIATLRAGDHLKGDANAAVIIFEYSDSDCPFCARFHPTLQKVVADYKGKVAWVYRNLPLDMHPNAYTEAIALECAANIGGNEAFWKYLDTVVNVTLDPTPESNQTLINNATALGIDADRFKACFADENIAKIVDGTIDEASRIGARGTPFSVAVNQKTGKQVVIPGAYPIDEVKKMIDSIL